MVSFVSLITVLNYGTKVGASKENKLEKILESIHTVRLRLRLRMFLLMFAST